MNTVVNNHVLTNKDNFAFLHEESCSPR